jgi:hypothetical protein
MITALSGPLRVSSMTLVAITLCAESGESVDALLRRTQEELASLGHEGVLKKLAISSCDEVLASRPSPKPPSHRSVTKSQQVEFCFAD